jgi:hypothetical protein
MTPTRRKFVYIGMESADRAGWLAQIIHRLR